jgi:hypothetical protein
VQGLVDLMHRRRIDQLLRAPPDEPVNRAQLALAWS